MRNNSLSAIGEILKETPLNLPIAGDCMVPALVRGDEVKVEGVGFILPGDVLLFREGVNLVAHRFLGWVFLPKQKGRVHAIVKADLAKRPDAPVPLVDCLGRLQTSVSKVQRIRAGQAYCRYIASAVRPKIGRAFSTEPLRGQ